MHPQFDPSQPTSASGGKALAVQAIMERHQCRTVIAIGDGATGKYLFRVIYDMTIRIISSLFYIFHVSSHFL